MAHWLGATVGAELTCGATNLLTNITMTVQEAQIYELQRQLNEVKQELQDCKLAKTLQFHFMQEQILCLRAKNSRLLDLIGPFVGPLTKVGGR